MVEKSEVEESGSGVLVAITGATYQAQDGRIVKIRKGLTANPLDPRVRGFEHFFVPLVPTFNESGGRRGRR